MIRTLLYIVIAIGLAGFAAVGWVAMHPPVPARVAVAGAPVPPPPPPRTVVLVAARPLRAGALLVPDDIGTRDVATADAEMIPDSAAARKLLTGGMIRRNIPAGTLLRAENILRSTERGFLAAVLRPGKLAVTIGVDQVSGAAGLIWPGDQVDIVLTQVLDDRAPAQHFSGETILSDVRVIAIDQQLMQGASGSDAAGRDIRTVTVEVTSAQAERIAVATRMGKLSLAVHAASPGPAASDQPAGGVTWAGDVSGALAAPGGKGGDGLRIYQGPDKSEEVHF